MTRKSTGALFTCALSFVSMPFRTETVTKITNNVCDENSSKACMVAEPDQLRMMAKNQFNSEISCS